jgi:uncharacterized protein (UPF0335 family)
MTTPVALPDAATERTERQDRNIQRIAARIQDIAHQMRQQGFNLNVPQLRAWAALLDNQSKALMNDRSP